MSREQAAEKGVQGKEGELALQAEPAGGEREDMETLANALRFEREKCEVLLGEVLALEDELVNRQMEDFQAVISEATKDFWREQLLSNREAATVALNELKEARSSGSASGAGEAAGSRRPLHNRERARPVVRNGAGGQAGGTEPREESLAVRIRNRAHELSRKERIGFSAAFRRAEREFSGQLAAGSLQSDQ